MMSDPKDGADKMSDAPQLVYCPKDHEYTVRCGKESCEKTTSVKRLLEACPLFVKEELHHHLGELIANEKSTKVVHLANEHRPHQIGGRLAQGSMRDMANASDHNPTHDGEHSSTNEMREECSDRPLAQADQSDHDVLVTLVWIDGEQEDQPRLLCESDMWANIERIAGDTKFEEIDGLLAALDSLIADTEANPLRPGESEGDRNTRLFMTWASDLLSGGQCKDYPLKFYTDALVLDRFFNHMNDNCQSFTQAQCDHFKETILPLYEQKAIQYGLPSRLKLQRHTHE